MKVIKGGSTGATTDAINLFLCGPNVLLCPTVILCGGSGGGGEDKYDISCTYTPDPMNPICGPLS